MTQHEAYRDELERTLDHCALDTLLEMLAEVCWEKSDHLLENDAKSALLWNRAGHLPRAGMPDRPSLPRQIFSW